MFEGRFWKFELARGLLALLLLGGAFGLRFADPLCLVAMVVTVALWAWPGWLWWPQWAKASSPQSRLVWGGLLGFLGVSAAAAFLGRCLGLPLWLAGLVASVAATALWGLVGRPRTLDPKRAQTKRRVQDVELTHILCCASLLALVAIWLPYEAVGRKTEQGFAYRHWFQNDFFNHMAISQSLSHGPIPPQNPYYAPEPMRYYWLFHVYPASVLQLTGHRASPQGLMLVYGGLVAVLFGAAVTLTIGAQDRRGASLMAWCVGLFAFNFQGTVLAFRALYGVATGAPPLLTLPFKDIGVLDHCSFGHGLEPGIESFYKQLLYSQQHLLGLLAILAVFEARRSRRSGARSGLLDGIVIALGLGFSSFMGLLGLGWLWACSLWECLRNRTRPPFAYAVASLLGAVLVGWGLLALGMGSKGLPLMFAPAKDALVWLPVYLLLSLGPALVFCLLLGRRGWAKIPWEMGILAALCLGLILLVDYEPLPGSLSNKIGFCLRIPVLMGACLWFNRVQGRIGLSKPIRWLVVGLGVPGFAMTLLLHASVSFPKGVSFVREEDRKACDWISRNIPLSGVVQPHPDYPGDPCSYSLASVFAGRDQALGDVHHACLFGPQWPQVAERGQRIQALFTAQDPAQAWSLARQLGIGWIYVGETERQTYGLEDLVFEKDRALFHRVYDEEGVRIFEVDTHPEAVSSAITGDPSANLAGH